MSSLFRASWWIQMLVSTFMTMVFIYLIKILCNKVNVPVVSGIVNAV